MLDLNSISDLKKYDTFNCLDATEAYDRQFAHVLEQASTLPLPPLSGPVSQVITIGTGGWSAQGVEIVQDLLFTEINVPLLNFPGYNLPAYVGRDSLVIILSKYGNVEEVMSTTQQALDRDAYIIAVLAGGPLLDVCRENNIPYLLMPLDSQPPRTLIGYSIVPLLVFMSRLGIIRDFSPEIREMIALFSGLAKEYGPQVPVAQNYAKQLALAIQGSIPLVYGSLDHYASVASRWKRQFGENSKMMAFYNVIPSLHHDEAVGWEMEQELFEKICLIMLRDQEADGAKITKRKTITLELLRDKIPTVLEICAKGDSLVSRMFSLIYLADFVTIYLALVREVNPGSVKIIDLFKQKMAEN